MLFLLVMLIKSYLMMLVQLYQSQCKMVVLIIFCQKIRENNDALMKTVVIDVDAVVLFQMRACTGTYGARTPCSSLRS